MPDGNSTCTVEYREIPGFPGYMAGNDGTIWSCKQQRGKAKGNEWVGWEIGTHRKPMKASPARGGYRKVSFCREGKYTTIHAHIAILLAFVGPCPEGQQCRHENGVRSDNRLANLSWGTPKENAEDRDRHGTTAKGTGQTQAKLDDDKVREIRRLRATTTSQKLADRFGVSNAAIYAVVKRIRWKHVA